MIRARRNGCVLGVLVLLSGCAQFKSPQGKALDLKAYDSVIVDEVRVGSGISHRQGAALLKGLTEIELVTSKKWKPSADLDLEAFARRAEQYLTTPGTINGKPLKPAMTQEEFMKKYAQEKARLKPLLDGPRGSNPVRLQLTITRIRFPAKLEKTVWGSNAEMNCRADLLAGGSRLGTAELKSTAGMPSPPLLPVGVAARAVGEMVADENTRKTVVQLVSDMSKNIARALDSAK